MANTVTANMKFKLPQLGKKPWKSDWDTNWTIADQVLGGLTVDGSVHAKIADAIPGSALTPFIQTVSGDLSAAAPIPAGETHEMRVDHSADLIFDIPSDPIFLVPSTDVNVVLLGERQALSDTETGGVFTVRIENHSDSTVNGSDISWQRKGLKTS